jgi:Carboxypeptidase regulatory-like domain
MRVLLRTLALIALVQLPLYAQLNVGGITGTVHDPSGAVMPGVRIVATNTGTALTEEAVTNAAGVYVTKLLPIGTYTVSVSQAGFQKFERTNIQVVSGDGHH